MFFHRIFFENNKHDNETIEAAIDSALANLERYLRENDIPEENVLGIKEFENNGRIGISVYMRTQMYI